MLPNLLDDMVYQESLLSGAREGGEDPEREGMLTVGEPFKCLSIRFTPTGERHSNNQIMIGCNQ